MTPALRLTGLLLLCSTASSLAQTPQLIATPPAAEAEKLRTLFSAALAKRDPKARAAFLAFGEKLGHKYEFDGLRDFGMRPRAKYAHKVAKAFETLTDPWCAWIRVDELGQPGDGKAQTRPTANMGAEVMGQVVKLNSKGVVRASLFLSRELLDLSQPIEVLWNGKSVYKGKPECDLGTLLVTALDRADWKQTFECALPLRCP